MKTKLKKPELIPVFLVLSARSESRTRMTVRSLDPEPSVSTNSTIRAGLKKHRNLGEQKLIFK